MLLSRFKLFKGIPFLVLFIGLVGCDLTLADRNDSINKTFQVAPGGRLTLDVNFGSIEVSTSADKEVHIEVLRKVKTSDSKKAEEILKNHQVDFRQEGNDVSVKTLNSGMSFWRNFSNHLEVRYVITVPQKYNVDLKTAGGSISVNELEGQVISKTSGGSLHFGHIQGPVSGKTSGGSITVLECSGKVDVNTSGGSLNLGKIAGPLNAHTSGGSIQIDEVMGDVRASTSGGSIRATISKQPSSDCELSTSGGSIHLNLNKDLNLNLVAKANGGSVHTDVPITIQGTLSKSSVQGKMNAGGPELFVETSGGSVYINKLQ
jgi:DUF4097 and DUF4098 domain-containing protein YvlB